MLSNMCNRRRRSLLLMLQQKKAEPAARNNTPRKEKLRAPTKCSAAQSAASDNTAACTLRGLAL